MKLFAYFVPIGQRFGFLVVSLSNLRLPRMPNFIIYAAN